MGYQRNHYNLMQFTSERKPYTYKVVPQLVSVSTNKGSIWGNELLIQGNSFGEEKSQVKVQVGGVECRVNEVTNSWLKCSLRPDDQPLSTEKVQLPQGISYQKYNSKNTNTIRNSILNDAGNSIKADLLEEGNLGNFEIQKIMAKTGVRMYGFFKAPFEGQY